MEEEAHVGMVPSECGALVDGGGGHVVGFRDGAVVVVDQEARFGDLHAAVAEPEEVPVVAVGGAGGSGDVGEVVEKERVETVGVLLKGVVGDGVVVEEALESDVPVDVVFHNQGGGVLVVDYAADTQTGFSGLVERLVCTEDQPTSIWHSYVPSSYLRC